MVWFDWFGYEINDDAQNITSGFTIATKENTWDDERSVALAAKPLDASGNISLPFMIVQNESSVKPVRINVTVMDLFYDSETYQYLQNPSKLSPIIPARSVEGNLVFGGINIKANGWGESNNYMSETGGNPSIIFGGQTLHFSNISFTVNTVRRDGDDCKTDNIVHDDTFDMLGTAELCVERKDSNGCKMFVDLGNISTARNNSVNFDIPTNTEGNHFTQEEGDIYVRIILKFKEIRFNYTVNQFNLPISLRMYVASGITDTHSVDDAGYGENSLGVRLIGKETKNVSYLALVDSVDCVEISSSCTINWKTDDVKQVSRFDLPPIPDDGRDHHAGGYASIEWPIELPVSGMEVYFRYNGNPRYYDERKEDYFEYLRYKCRPSIVKNNNDTVLPIQEMDYANMEYGDSRTFIFSFNDVSITDIKDIGVNLSEISPNRGNALSQPSPVQYITNGTNVITTTVNGIIDTAKLESWSHQLQHINLSDEELADLFAEIEVEVANAGEPEEIEINENNGD